jgi:hypothetical protein
MPRTEAQKRARKAYEAKCRKLVVTIYPTESDLLKQIDSQESYSEYIKSLIWKDIQKKS